MCNMQIREGLETTSKIKSQKVKGLRREDEGRRPGGITLEKETTVQLTRYRRTADREILLLLPFAAFSVSSSSIARARLGRLPVGSHPSQFLSVTSPSTFSHSVTHILATNHQLWSSHFSPNRAPSSLSYIFYFSFFLTYPRSRTRGKQ